jgi:hypothetical protein
MAQGEYVMYLIYAADGATDEWLFWNNKDGWGSLESAEAFDHTGYDLPMEGEWLYIGDTNLKPLAAIILDLEVVLARHTDTNLASPAGRLALAGWLAQGLQLARDWTQLGWYVRFGRVEWYDSKTGDIKE